MSNRIIFEGVLAKWNGKTTLGRKKWQTRHCILRQHRLQYGVMDKENQFKEKKHILKINAISVEEKHDDSKQLIFVLTVRDYSNSMSESINDIRKFEFKADSTRTRDTWISQLTKWIGTNPTTSDISVSATNISPQSPTTTSSTSSSALPIRGRRRSTAVSSASSSPLSDVLELASPSSIIGTLTDKFRESVSEVRSRVRSGSIGSRSVDSSDHNSSKDDSTKGSEDEMSEVSNVSERVTEKSIPDDATDIQSAMDPRYEEDIKTREDRSEQKRFEKIRDFFPDGDSNDAKKIAVEDPGVRINLKEQMVGMQQFIDYALKEARAAESLKKAQQVTSSDVVTIQPKDQVQVELFIKSHLKSEKIYWSGYCGREDPAKKNAAELVILVLTDKRLLIVNPDTYELVRKLDLGKVKHILQSGYDQSIVSIVHSESDYDILLHFKMEKTKKSVESNLSENKTYDKKIEFFDCITALYRLFTESKGNRIDLRVFFVSDVYALSRRSGTSGNKVDIASEKKNPKEVPKSLRLNPVDIVQINYPNDKIHIYSSPSLLKMISNFGDKEILFAGNVEKMNKNRKYQTRLLVISDAAIYLFSNINAKNITRRVELDEVGELVKPLNYKDQLLIRVPDEYDIYIQSKLYVETICGIFKEIFYDPYDELIRVTTANEDILRFAVLEKTRAYKKKTDQLDNYEAIINSLRNAITQHDANKMKLFIEYANQHETNHKTVPNDVQTGIKETARKELNKIKEQEMIKEGYAQALADGNVVKIDEWSRKISQLKIVYEPLKLYLKKVEKRRVKIMNKAAILSRIKYAIDHHLKANSEEIEAALDAALRAGFVDEVEEYKKIYELEIQKSVLPMQLEEAQKSHDVDKLLTIIESAKCCGIYSDNSGKNTKFQAAEQNLQEYINKKRISNSIMEAIEDARKTNKTSNLDALCKKQLDTHKWIATTPAYAAAHKTIEEIKNFRVEILKLNKAVDLLEPKINEKSASLLDKKTTDIITKYIDRIHSIMNEKSLCLGKKDEQIIQRANETLAKANQIVRAIKSEEAGKLLQRIQKSIQSNEPSSVQLQLISEAKQYIEYNNELEALVSHTEGKIQTKVELESLDERQYTYAHVDHVNNLISNAERYNLMTNESDAKLQRIYENVTKEYDVYQNLRSSLDADDTHLVKVCIVEAMDYSSMDEIINEAKLYLNKKRIEEISIRKNLEKAIKNNDYGKMLELVQQAQSFSNLEPIVQKAQSKLRGEDDSEVKHEEEIERYIIARDAEGLSEYISQHENSIPSQLLKEAKARLNKLRGESFTVEDIKQAMIASISAKDLNELNTAIANAENMLLTADSDTEKALQALLKRGREIQQKLQQSENIGLVRSVHDQFHEMEAPEQEFVLQNDLKEFTTLLKNGVLYSGLGQVKSEGAPTELLERLISHVTKLRSASASQGKFDEKLGKYIVKMNDKLGQNVVVVLSDVLGHKPKKRFFSQIKTSYEILKGLRRPEVQRLIDKFEDLELVQGLLQEKQFDNLSVLFVHFVLSEGQFMNVLSCLLTNDAYMKDAYDTAALLRGVAYRDEIYPYLSILNMFQFEFALASKSDALIASPISRLKSTVRSIVQYFVSHKVEAMGNLKTVGTESWNDALGPLIRNELCGALLAIVMHKFKASGFFVKYSLWQMIEEASESRKVSAIDVGGLLLPSCVHYINEHVHLTTDQKKIESELKFKALVCYCLNERSLIDVFETIFKDQELLIRYYDVEDKQKPFVMDSALFKKACVYLRTLSKLPFDLYISGDGERLVHQKSRLGADGTTVYDLTSK